MISKRKLFNTTVLKIFSGLLLMLLVIQFLSPVSFSAGTLELEAGLKFWGKGRTFIYLPPLGKLTAATHLPPLDFYLTLKSVNIVNKDELTKFTENTNALSAGIWSGELFQEIKTNVIKYLVFLLLLVFLVGMAGALLWTRRCVNKKEMFLAGLANLLVLLMFLSIALFSYNPAAFLEAEYQGALEAAPLVFHVLQEGAGVVESMGSQFTEVVENIFFLQNEVGKNAVLENNQDTVKVLHVSDIHNNPAAFNFIRRIVETFNVELIIDTGDIVDYGTELELELVAGFFEKIKVPYIFIPGNHESVQVVEQLKTIENVIVLENGDLEMANLKIAGLADPASFSGAPSIPDEDLMEKKAQEFAESIAHNGGATIIAAHNPDMFKYLRKDGNLLLGGHLHKPYIKKNEGYIEINAGSTGASGIRGIQNLEINFSLVLLDFHNEGEHYIPFSADLIKVEQFPLNFSLERFIFAD